MSEAGLLHFVTSLAANGISFTARSLHAVKMYPVLFYGIIVEQSGPVFSKGISCLVSRILLSALFALYLVFVSGWLVCINSAGVGLGQGGT